MTSAAELRAHKANTRAFIGANAKTVELIPRSRMTDGSGTRLVNGAKREPQVVRLIDQSTARNTIPGRVQTSDGVDRFIDFILLAESCATIELWDFWVDDEGTWEVAEVYPDNGYEIRAAVVRRA